MSRKKQELPIDQYLPRSPSPIDNFSDKQFNQNLTTMVKQFILDSKISSVDRIKNDQHLIMKKRFIYSDDDDSSSDEEQYSIFNNTEKDLLTANCNDSINGEDYEETVVTKEAITDSKETIIIDNIINCEVTNIDKKEITKKETVNIIAGEFFKYEDLEMEYKSEWAKYQITKREAEFLNERMSLQEKNLKKIKRLLGFCDCTIDCVDRK